MSNRVLKLYIGVPILRFIISGDQRDILRHDNIRAPFDVEEGQGDTQTGWQERESLEYYNVTRLDELLSPMLPAVTRWS